MLGLVKTRLLRPLVYILVAAQLLLAPPVVSAFVSGDFGSAVVTPCAGEMPVAAESDPCPCCPDGISKAECLANCTAVVAAAPSLPLVTVCIVANVIAIAPVSGVVCLSDPPLKPPPII